MLKFIKQSTIMCIALLIIVVFVGCSKDQSVIEGKVIDGAGQPMSGVKITAKQFRPIKGYEKIETITDSNGVFRLAGLFPVSEYSIVPWSDDWTISEKPMVKTGLKGKIKRLASPIIIRFTLLKNGIINDSQLGAQWLPASDKPMDWFQANRYVENICLNGGGWRLPTRSELKSIYDVSMKGGADPFFRINENWVWTSETQGDSAWFCSFVYGREGTIFQKYIGSYGRVLAIRNKM
ncbi:MAG TPA: DUF1566 domain-containing protein [Syntrophorhabdaceae bacterium]|nr:DUF1566 domain-containing protein [Syntrophorhabdaceae bacterium]